NIVKSYQNGDQVLKVLKGINLTVYVGDIVIANPDKNIKPDKKLEGVISIGTNTKPEKDSQSKNKKSGVDK
ncbi:hypothetical protein ACO0EY_06845, partial [Streptococcus pyogenes]